MTAFLSIILAAAAVTPPSPVDARKWILPQQYPQTTLLVSERDGVGYTIDVAPDGTKLRCETEKKLRLDKEICSILMRNARFLPAKDDQGNAVFGVHEGFANFAYPGKSQWRDRSKLAITLDQLPNGVTSPAFAKVAFFVDSAGAINNCTATAGERRRGNQAVETLAPTACEKVVKEYHPSPARNAAGEPVPSVQTVQVRFEVPQKP